MKEQQDMFNSNLDYKKVIQRFLSFRRIYIFLIIALLIAAFLVNRYFKGQIQEFNNPLPYPG